MDSLAQPFASFLLLFSGRINRQQQDVIDYLLEENRVLRAAHGSHRIRLSDDQRRRLAVKGKVLGRRRLADVAGITSQANEHWMNQMARNLTDPHDGFLNDVRHLIVDRDPLYTASARNLLRDSGVKLVRLPARSPNLNAFAERFVESIRAECLARIVPLGERHLRTTVRTFVEHYHEERPHQGLSNALIPPRTKLVGEGPAQCKQRLGGMLKFYHRAAA